MWKPGPEKRYDQFLFQAFKDRSNCEEHNVMLVFLLKKYMLDNYKSSKV